MLWRHFGLCISNRSFKARMLLYNSNCCQSTESIESRPTVYKRRNQGGKKAICLPSIFWTCGGSHCKMAPFVMQIYESIRYYSYRLRFRPTINMLSKCRYIASAFGGLGLSAAPIDPWTPVGRLLSTRPPKSIAPYPYRYSTDASAMRRG